MWREQIGDEAFDSLFPKEQRDKDGKRRQKAWSGRYEPRDGINTKHGELIYVEPNDLEKMLAVENTSNEELVWGTLGRVRHVLHLPDERRVIDFVSYPEFVIWWTEGVDRGPRPEKKVRQPSRGEIKLTHALAHFDTPSSVLIDRFRYHVKMGTTPILKAVRNDFNEVMDGLVEPYESDAGVHNALWGKKGRKPTGVMFEMWMLLNSVNILHPWAFGDLVATSGQWDDGLSIEFAGHPDELRAMWSKLKRQRSVYRRSAQ